MKKIFLAVVVLFCFLTVGNGQELEQPAQDAVDVDGQVYPSPPGMRAFISSADCAAQGGRVVEDSERCNYDEVSCGRVSDANCYCKCCKKPSPEDQGAILGKLQKYFSADPAP